MTSTHNRATIVSMAVVASGLATLLHEGLGHGVTAYLRGDVVTELTSNHLSSMRPDRLVDAAGTLVNLAVGAVSLLLAGRIRGAANARYFLWLFAALNLLPGAGYFLFSGLIGFGDWNEVIKGLPHHGLLRAAMAVFGALLYVVVVRALALALRPFLSERGEYNTASRLPYYAACVFSCIAGAFDPLGIQLLLVSTIPAAFGGSSGMMWGDAFLREPYVENPLRVSKAVSWWVAAAVFGVAYVVVLGRGVQFGHGTRW